MATTRKQSSYQRLMKAKAEVETVLAKSQENEGTNAQALTDLVHIAKASPEGARLVQAYYEEVVKANRTDLSGAIGAVIFNAENAAKAASKSPYQPSPIAKAVADDLAEQVKKGNVKKSGGVRWAVGPQSGVDGR